jgi:hypothetical protein
MAQAEYSTVINRSAADVFAFLADGERGGEWRPGVMECRKQSGEGVGATYDQWVRGPGGRRVAAHYRVTQSDPPRLLAFEAIAGPVRPVGRYELVEENGSTRVTFSLDSRLGGFRKLFMGPMVNKTMQAEVRCLDNLKQLMESQ